MKKPTKIAMALALMASPLAHAQNAPITFEAGGYGSDWSFNTFENGDFGNTGNIFQTVANPDTSGLNASATVAHLVCDAAGQPWAGAETFHTQGIGTFNLTYANCIVKMWVYKPVISDVGIKFAKPDGGSNGELKVANTKINEWEELTFDFTSRVTEAVSTGIDQIVFFPDFNLAGRGQNNDCYIDNVTFSAGVNPNPTPPPTTPPVATGTQKAPITFETGEYGSDWSFNTFENGDFGNTGNIFQTIANPNTTGLNTSATVAHLVCDVAGQPWAGAETFHGQGIGTFNLTYGNCIVKMWVYKPVISDVGIKFAKPDGGSNGELKVANTKINEWEELTFDFTSRVTEAVSTGIDQIVFFPDFNLAGRAQNNDCYIDNITFSAGVAPVVTTPTAAAATPTDTFVVSMFSNAYTNVAMSTWRTSWSGGGALTELQVAGDDVKKYGNLAYFGAEPVAPIDASAMSTFHIDVWTADVTTFRVKLRDYGANGVWNDGGDDTEHEITLTAPTLGGWTRYNIPLSDFTGMQHTSHIGQLIPSGSAGTIFIDNVYFSGTAPTAPSAAVAAPTTPADQVISLFSNAYTNVSMGTWRTGWSGGSTLTDTTVAGDDIKKYEGLAYFGAEPTAQIDASAMTKFHVDVWTADVTPFRVKLVNFGPGGNSEHELSRTPTLGGWNSYDFNLSDFVGMTGKANIGQLIISTSGFAGTVFLDNMYFSGPAVTYTKAEYNAAIAAATASASASASAAGRVTGRADVVADPGSYGLYTEASIQDLKTTGQVIVGAGASSVNLTLPVQKSTTLGSWQTAGNLQLTLPKEGSKQFYRIKVN